jgi:hypothetical protein
MTTTTYFLPCSDNIITDLADDINCHYNNLSNNLSKDYPTNLSSVTSPTLNNSPGSYTYSSPTIPAPVEPVEPIDPIKPVSPHPITSLSTEQEFHSYLLPIPKNPIIHG